MTKLFILKLFFKLSLYRRYWDGKFHSSLRSPPELRGRGEIRGGGGGRQGGGGGGDKRWGRGEIRGGGRGR